MLILSDVQGHVASCRLPGTRQKFLRPLLPSFLTGSTARCGLQRVFSLNKSLFYWISASLLLSLQMQSLALADSLATVTARWQVVEQSYPAEAVVEAVHQATLAAQTSGRLVEVKVDAGDQVKAGELLMRIDAREAHEAVMAARARLDNARANLHRSRELLAQKFISQAALDQTEAAWKTAQAQARQANVSSSHALIKAPFSGVIASRLAEAGEMASPGRPLLRIFEPGDLRVVASIPQYKLAEIQQASTARVELPGAQWLDVSRVEILPTVDNSSHTVRVRLYLHKPPANVVPGLFARAHFITGNVEKLTAPASSIVRRNELTAVYILDGQGQPRLRQVRLGSRFADGSLEILSGVHPGERIVLDPLKAGFMRSKP